MLALPSSPGLPFPGHFDTAGRMFGPVSSTPEGGHQGMSLTPGVASRPPLPPGNKSFSYFYKYFLFNTWNYRAALAKCV